MLHDGCRPHVSVILGLGLGSTLGLKIGAECSNPACSDLRGGLGATSVPIATLYLLNSNLNPPPRLERTRSGRRSSVQFPELSMLPSSPLNCIIELYAIAPTLRFAFAQNLGRNQTIRFPTYTGERADSFLFPSQK